ncbi:chymotrypsin inhibitor-like isoform 2-T2 [Cochliomyia hominivorax]
MINYLKKFFFIFFILLVLEISKQVQSKECPLNQEWDTCGSACPEECGESAPYLCTHICVKGCRCKEGYLLKSSGECVLAADC